MSYFINPVEEEECVFLTHEGEMSLVEAAAASIMLLARFAR